MYGIRDFLARDRMNVGEKLLQSAKINLKTDPPGPNFGLRTHHAGPSLYPEELVTVCYTNLGTVASIAITKKTAISVNILWQRKLKIVVTSVLPWI